MTANRRRFAFVADFDCPRCHATAGRPCRGERIAFEDGWRGFVTLRRPHAERRAVRRAFMEQVRGVRRDH